MLEPCFGD